MQIVTIVGNLTRDPESRTTQSGKEVCNFTVAVNRRQKKQDGTNEADFFRVSAWEQLGKACQTYLAKGRKVCVRGTISAHAYQDNEGNPAASLDLFAQEVEFLSPAGQGGQGGTGQSTAPVPEPASAPSEGYQAVDSDELPF